MLKKIFLSLLAAISLTLTACSQPKPANEIVVGTISGPETQLMQVAKDVAQKKYGIDVKIVEFNDYTMPNTALKDGSLDANMFQHQSYLDAYNKKTGGDLVAIGKTFIYPMGIYSAHHKHLADIPTHGIVGIPNDPSNEARALILLTKAGIITLKPGINPGTATPKDIATNYKNLEIRELDAAQLPRILSDVSLAVINSNYAVPAGLYPSKDALFTEQKDSPYANLVVVRAADKNNPQLKKLVEALHSQEVVAEAKKLFHGEAIQAW